MEMPLHLMINTSYFTGTIVNGIALVQKKQHLPYLYLRKFPQEECTYSEILQGDRKKEFLHMKMESRFGGRLIPATIRRVNKRCVRSEEHTSELQSRQYLVCRLLLEKKK